MHRLLLLVLLVACSPSTSEPTDARSSGVEAPPANRSTADAAARAVVEKYRSTSVERWEDDIRAFEALDAETTDPQDAILFVGSSSIRLWDHIEADMAPYGVIQRGYGGASWADVAHYTERLVYPHDFAALVLFAGNDIWGKPDDRSPEELQLLLHHTVQTVREQYPDPPIFVIEITHVPVREHLVREIDAANAALQRAVNRFENVHWIPTRDLYLNDDGTVNTERFGEDRTHQNRTGYGLWTERIKRALNRVLD